MALSWLLGNGGVEVVMMMVEVLVGANWELSVPVVAAAVVVVVVVALAVVASVVVVVVAIVVVVVVVGSLPRKRGNNTAGSSVVLVVAAAVGLVGLGRGLMMVVEVLVVVVVVVGGGGGADAVVVTLRALTLFAAVSGANVGRSILTCWADEGVVGNPLLLLLLVVDDDESPSLSLSPKPSSSKSASKSLDGVVLPPAAPPAGRLPASTLLSRPGPATRITCAIMRLTIESISCRWGGEEREGETDRYCTMAE